jgi:transketolase
MPVTSELESAADASVTRFHRELAQQLRTDSARACGAAGSVPHASSMSAAELIAVLLDGYLGLDSSHPEHPRRDHLIFSRGRASALYYAMLKAAGAIGDEELLNSQRIGSDHLAGSAPAPLADVATGSLGQGLPIGVGIALAGKRLDRLPYRVWVLCGDSDMDADSTWEAFRQAGWAGLDNLSVIADMERHGQAGPAGKTMPGRDLGPYAERARALGWQAMAIDGHDVAAIDQAYQQVAASTGRPTVIFADTARDREVTVLGERHLQVRVVLPATHDRPRQLQVSERPLPHWDSGEQVATCEAYGQALAALGDARGDVVALDGEVSASRSSEPFARAHPDRYFDMFLAEQQMVAAAVGMQVRGWVPFATTCASSLSHAYDFVRTAAMAGANLRLVGSQPAAPDNAAGPGQMAWDDFAFLRAIHGSAVLHPSDANQVPPLLAQTADRPGVSYLRTLSPPTVVRTRPGEDIRVGGSRLVRGGEDDDVTLVACGATVGEADDAAGQLEREGVPVRVIDCYSIKPIDADALRSAASQTEVILTVEDHRPEGGLGEAVLSALADQPHRPPILRLAVRDLPTASRHPHPQQPAAICAEAIVAAVRAHLSTATGAHYR